MPRLVLCALLCVLPAAAQLDSPALRARFGTPLNRETFHMPAGFDLVVDYGTHQQVCKLTVPALMPTDDNPANSDVMRQRMHAFLAELVPDWMRGKEVGRVASAFGVVWLLLTDYQSVSIQELLTGPASADRDTITVIFKNNCPAVGSTPGNR